MHAIVHFLLHANPIIICLIVLVILALESTGAPVTNNTLLLVTGAFASQGHLNIWILCVAAILGSILGATSAYAIGAYGGRPVLLRIASFFHIEEQKVQLAEQWFHKSGFWMVFLSRMMPYVRPFACFPAGIAHMPFPRFFVAASSGSIIWCIALLSIGWSLGRRWMLALHLIERYTLPVIGVLLLLLVTYMVIMRLVKRRLDKLATSANATKKNNEQHDNKLLEV